MQRISYDATRMDKEMTTKCESVEDFLSRGGKIEYAAPADERMQAIDDLDKVISSNLLDYQWAWDSITDPRVWEEIENGYRHRVLPRME